MGSLRERLAAKKPLSLEEVLTLGIEIGDALDAAHARGGTHGRLDPSCILLAEGGQEGATGIGLATGGVEGAAEYRSPEQVRGGEADARSDVFSLGAVLYEMATGHRAFEGASPAVVSDAILNSTPAPASALRQGVPEELDRIVGKALEKDPELRYQAVVEVRSDLVRLKKALESSRGVGAGAIVDPGSRTRPAMSVTPPTSVNLRRQFIRVAWTAAIVLAAVGAVLLAPRLWHRGPADKAVHLTLEMPSSLLAARGPFISPDGRYVAVSAYDSTAITDADSRIWVLPLDGTAARPLPGTEGAQPLLLWSPDSRFIGFVSGDRLKKVDLTGGEPVLIDARNLTYTQGWGSWGTAGTILLREDEICAVPAEGGQLEQVVWADRSRGEGQRGYPQFLPDGRHFLYLELRRGHPDSTALRVGCLGSRESKIIAIGRFTRTVYAPPGYLLRVSGATLLAQRFDWRRARLSGEAFPVVEDVLANNFTVSDQGTLAFYNADALSVTKTQLSWVDRAGQEIGRLGPVARYMGGLAISPDGKQVAVSMDSSGFQGDIWVYDIARNLATRITFGGRNDYLPAWSKDGATLFFTGDSGKGSRIFTKPASGMGEERELPLPRGYIETRCEDPVGSFLIAGRWNDLDAWPRNTSSSVAEIVKISLDSIPTITPLGNIKAVWQPSFALSPDGNWIAYASDETGRAEMYVVDFPGLTQKWRVSRDGVATAYHGGWPRWSADGKELYYLGPCSTGGALMSVPITTSPRFRAGRPVRIMESIPDMCMFAPTPDRNRFLIMTFSQEEKLPPARIVVNWPALLNRR